MPLYLVRWPDLSGALVQAEDEAHLRDILDEVGDPGGCRWVEYDGPLFLDLKMPIDVTVAGKDLPTERGRPLSMGNLQFSGLEELLAGEAVHYDLEITVASGDTGLDMLLRFYEWLFPGYTAYIESRGQHDPPKDLDKRKLEEALIKDLEPLIRYSWTRATLARRTDFRSRLMQYLDRTDSLPGEDELEGPDEPR